MTVFERRRWWNLEVSCLREKELMLSPDGTD